MDREYKYIYGPVPSWRLGSSLGIDPVSKKEKICTFDCIYCQLGRARSVGGERRTFVPVSGIISELTSLPSLHIDYITFSGTGEPTLAENLGDMIRAVRHVRPEKIAVLTNSTMMHDPGVIRDLALSDLVVCKLDASSQALFELINRPAEGIDINAIVNAIKGFKDHYKGKLALQVMFMEENKMCAEGIARIAKEIAPDEVQLNTPLRPCGIRPLAKEEMNGIEEHFHGLKTVSVYRADKKSVDPISSKETLKRRGKV
ncbi:MAG: radical SAM protein [Candidatus Omnitrophota bacterium]|jgi:wyosine [tRNA(Phe)-imidazoG37] synthetase (radical SAM superfamily)